MRRCRRHPLCRCDLGGREDRQVVETPRQCRKTIVSGEGLQVRDYVEHPLIRHLELSFTKVNEALTQP
jgi:hypothetical protein